MEHVSVTLIFPDHVQREGLFSFDEDADDCTLTLQFLTQALSATADDYFEAMCCIRHQIEDEGIRISCYGASQNVYPSAMARDMGQGLKAYKMTLGHHAKQADLVSIFATGDDVQLATVDEQRDFFHTWLKSLHS